MLQIGLVDRITKPMRQIQKQIGELQKSGIKIASATYAGIQALQPAIAVQEQMKTLRIEGVDTFKSLQDSAMFLNKNLSGSLPDAITLLKKTQTITNLNGKSLESAALSAGILTSKFQGLEQHQVLATQTQLMRSFGVSILQTSDALTFLAKQGGDLKGELLQGLQEYAPQFQGLGFSFMQMVKLSQTALSAGWNFDKGLDAFKEYGIKIKEMGKTQQTALAALGLQHVTKALGAGNMSGFQALQHIATKIPNIKNTTQQYKILQALFGTPMEDVGLKPMLKMLESINQGIPDLLDSFATLQKQMQSGFMPQWNKFTASLGNAWVIIAQQILPFFTRMITWLAKLAQRIEAYTKAFPILSQGLGYLVFGFLGFIIVVSALAALIATFTASLLSLKIVIKKLYILQGLKWIMTPIISIFKLWQLGILGAIVKIKLLNAIIIAKTIIMKIWAGVMFFTNGVIKILTISANLLKVAFATNPFGAVILGAVTLSYGINLIVEKFGGWLTIWKTLKAWAVSFFEWITNKFQGLVKLFDEIKNPLEKLGGFFGFSQTTEATHKVIEEQKKTQDKINPLAQLTAPVKKVVAGVTVAAAPMVATAGQSQLHIQPPAKTNPQLQTAVQNVANQSNMNGQNIFNISTNQRLNAEDIKQAAFENFAT